jgi:hypothetical protein
MFSADLQALTDDVAQRLRAPAVLEDEEQRMIAYSSHTTLIDEIRRDSILRRETKPAVREWFRRFGILESVDPVRIPRDERLGILGRLCVPVRHHGRLSGFLWLIDDDDRLGPDEIAIATQAARQAGMLMYEDVMVERLATTALAQLLSPSEEVRTDAARQVFEEALLPGKTSVSVVVVQVVDLDEVSLRLTINEGIRDVTRRHPSGDLLGLPHGDHIAILVPSRGGLDESVDRAEEIAHEAREALSRRLCDRSARATAVAGIGDPQPHLETAHQSYREARLAARVAAAIPSFGATAHWRNLGVYRAISLLPGADSVHAAIDPRLQRLFEDGDEEVLETLETYLDLGGDGQAAAERLYLHRGTLYYRLKKAQKVSGIDLHDGRDRLAVHLGFKIARMTGVYPRSA